MNTIDNTANIIAELKSLPEFKKTKHIDLVDMLESKSANVPLSAHLKLSALNKQPMYAKRPLLSSKAAVGVVTNQTVPTITTALETPVQGYGAVSEQVLFDVLETLPVATGNMSFTKAIADAFTEADLQVNEGDLLTANLADFAPAKVLTDNVTYSLSLTQQALDDTKALALIETVCKQKVTKKAATQCLGQLAQFKQALSVTETELLDKLEEALLALPHEVEAKLLVVNKADALAIGKAKRALGIVEQGLFGLPILTSDVAVANEILILTNSAILFVEDASLQYGFTNDDFTTNKQTLKINQRVGASELTANGVYSVATA